MGARTTELSPSSLTHGVGGGDGVRRRRGDTAGWRTGGGDGMRRRGWGGGGAYTAVVATVEAELDLAVATAVEKAVEVKNFHRSSRFRPIP